MPFRGFMSACGRFWDAFSGVSWKALGGIWGACSFVVATLGGSLGTSGFLLGVMGLSWVVQRVFGGRMGQPCGRFWGPWVVKKYMIDLRNGMLDDGE